MNLLLLLTIITGATFLLRFAGLTLKVAQTSPFWERFLQFVPISIFTALVVSSLYTAPELLTLKIIALAAGAGVMWRTRQFGLGVVTGLAVLWILSLVSTS